MHTLIKPYTITLHELETTPKFLVKVNLGLTGQITDGGPKKPFLAQYRFHTQEEALAHKLDLEEFYNVYPA